MEHAQATYPLDEHHMTLSKTNNRLLLEIEHRPTGRCFSLELENDAISQASNETFSDVNAMRQGLEDALKKTYKEVALSFDGNGKLTYKVSFSMGPLKKNHQFTLLFQEKGLSPWTLCERRLEDKLVGIGAKIASIEQAVRANSENNQVVNQVVGKHMQRFDVENEDLKEHLSKFEKRMLEKFEALEERIVSLEGMKKQKYADVTYVNNIVCRLEQKIAEKFEKLEKLEKMEKNAVIKPVAYEELFNTNTSHASSFTFSNNNKTAELTTTLFDRELAFSRPLPRSGKFSLSLKLEKVERYIFVGLISEHNFVKTSWNQHSFYYFTENGYIYGGTAKPPQKSSVSSFGQTGDILSIEVDIDLGLVSFLVNKVEINYFYMDLKSSRYVPYCGFSQSGCKVSII